MSRLKLAITLAVMLISFMIHYDLQEALVPKRQGPDDFHFPDLLGLFCNLSNAIAALIAIALTQTPWRCWPFPFILIAIPQRLSLALQTHAQLYVDFPTLQLSKSSKPIAILLAMAAIERRLPTLKRAVLVTILTIGFAIFGFAGKFERSSLFGFVLVIGALFLDGIYVPIVDRLKTKAEQPRPFTAMLYTQMWSFIIGGIFCTGQIIEGAQWIAAHPSVVRKLMMYAVTGSAGQIALWCALGMTDGLVVAIATTCRKLVTILRSAVVYKHNLKPMQWTGVTIVFFGLALEHFWSYMDRKKKGEKKKCEEEIKSSVQKEEEEERPRIMTHSGSFY